MSIKVGLADIEQSNRFLRAFWADLRANFPNYGWLYQPYKDGRRRKIFLGNLDLGLSDGSLATSISYKQRGSIQEIFFEFSNGRAVSNNSELGNKLVKCVNSALAKLHHPECIFIQGYIKNLHLPLCNYSDPRFKIQQISQLHSALTIQVQAYDKVDAKAQFLVKAYQFMDILAIETNTPFWLASNKEPLEKNSAIASEVFVSDNDWLADIPVLEGFMVISRAGKQLLSLIAEDKADKEEMITFLRACQHFHTARKYDAQISDRVFIEELQAISETELSIAIKERDSRLSSACQMGSTHNEIATVLYMSALEVAANIGIAPVKTCEKCDQPVYSIRKRVVDMASRYLPTHIVKEFITDNYDKRSKYLHTGILLTDQTYRGKAIPQLDKSNPSGCKVINQVPLLNVREFTGYCLRKILQSLYCK